MLISRAMCGLTHVTVAALCCSCSLLCISNSDWATENEAGRSVSVSCNEETRWRDLSPTQFNCDWNYSLITHNKTPVLSTWGLLRVCAACSTPRLNLSSELRSSWNSIQDTFLAMSALDKTMSPVKFATHRYKSHVVWLMNVRQGSRSCDFCKRCHTNAGRQIGNDKQIYKMSTVQNTNGTFV